MGRELTTFWVRQHILNQFAMLSLERIRLLSTKKSLTYRSSITRKEEKQTLHPVNLREPAAALLFLFLICSE